MRERMADQRRLAFHPTGSGLGHARRPIRSARGVGRASLYLSVRLSIHLSIYLARALIALGLEGREGVVTLRTANMLPEHLGTNSG